jgi:hypothetical protein
MIPNYFASRDIVFDGLLKNPPCSMPSIPKMETSIRSLEMSSWRRQAESPHCLLFRLYRTSTALSGA